MSKQILVPLKLHDEVDEVLPYVERVAQPGMKVVFLRRYPGTSLGSMLPLFAKMEGGMPERLAGTRQLADIYSWEGNAQRAERKISAAREVLERNGVKVDVSVYAGSLRRFVRNYGLKNDVHLIVAPAGIGSWITTLVSGTLSVSRWFRRPHFSTAVLIHPSTR